MIAIYGKAPKQSSDRDLTDLLLKNFCSEFDSIAVWQPFFETINNKDFFNGRITLFNTKEELLKLQKNQTVCQNILLSLGGDGTMLDTVDYVIGTDIAVLGINLGHLGFLTTAGRKDINNLTKEIIKGNFSIEQRPILQAEYSFKSDNRKFAVNEACFLSTNRGSIIDLEVFINDRYVSTYSGDGVIIATPTGSTAYSMSAGGPIITPESRCLCITPIAPHNLTFRPVIISDNDVIKVKIPNTEHPCKILLDGYFIADKYEGGITVKKSPYNWNLVRLSNMDFYSNLRNKLMWGQAPVYMSGNL